MITCRAAGPGTTPQRRRRVTELLDRGEIDAPFDEVRLGDSLIEEPSGDVLSRG